jgi:hypothetical protein
MPCVHNQHMKDQCISGGYIQFIDNQEGIFSSLEIQFFGTVCQVVW